MKHILRIALYVTLLLVFHTPLHAQGRYLRGGTDLSSSMINNIFQDNDGIIWIGTENGLNRMDGAKRRVLYRDDSSNSIFGTTFQDSKGRIFVCSAQNILMYHPENETLQTIPAFLEDGRQYNFQGNGFIETPDKKILVYTSGNGLFRLDETTDSLTLQQDNMGLNQFMLPCMIQDTKGRLWAGTEGGLMLCQGGKWQRVCADVIRGEQVTSMIQADDGNIWCASDHGGVWQVDANTFQCTAVPGMASLPVRCLILGKNKNTLLAGTNGFGAYAIHIQNYQVEPFSIVAGPIDGSSLNIHTMLIDRQGNLWVGCFQKGVVVLPNRPTGFDNIGPHSPLKNFIGTACVMSLLQQQDGTLWVATDNDGLYAVTDKGSQHFAPSATMPNTVMSMTIDSQGTLWLGTWQQGLWKMRLGMTGAQKVNLPLFNGAEQNVFSIKEDNAGNIWVATMGDGIWKINLGTGEISTTAKRENGQTFSDTHNYIPNRWINAIHISRSNVLYMATFDGLGAMDLGTGSFLTPLHGVNRILPGQTVICLHETPDGHLWLGTSKGLIRYNPVNGEMKTFTQKDGLASNTIQSIQDDGNGALWISTNSGVTRMKYQTQEFFNYYSGNGLQSNEFSKNAAFTNSQGVMFFGGTDGVSSFDPRKIFTSAEAPQVYISGLYVNGRETFASTLSGGQPVTHEGSIWNATQLTLDPDDCDFSLELSTLNFINPESTLYEYTLNDSDWKALRTGEYTLNFNNMEPGTYHIQVRAKQFDSYGPVRSIQVTIRNYWYHSWWMYAVYMLLLAAAMLGVHRWVMARRARRLAALHQKYQEEMNEAKLQYFVNISHEIRTPMSLILSPLQRLISTDTDGQRQNAYQLINRNAQRILQLINQLMDMRKIEHGQMQLHFSQVEMVEYIRQLIQGFSDQCQTRGITLGLTHQLPIMPAWIDPLNFDKILVNLIGNAFKFTPDGGSISIDLQQTHSQLQLTVKDTGAGLSPDDIDKLFDRFYQAHNQANQKTQGTGIGLNLTRSLVQLHHGTITVANNTDGPGCHFTILLPLGFAHLSPEELKGAPAATQPVAQPAAPAPVQAAAQPVQPHRSRPRTNKLLYVVEDDKEIQQYLQTELGQSFHVSIFQNGEEALQALHQRVPDLIISDVMMPVMDGITLLRHIRQNTSYNSIPVILLTAKSREEDNLEGLEHGADAYITKPFNVDILLRTALNLIQGREQLKNIYKGNQNMKGKFDPIHVVSPDEKLMERIMKVINDNLSNPNLNNDLVTQAVGISRVHLYRKLKEMTNLSLRDFVRNVRLEEAARLLGEHRHSIAEIAERTGFDNASYFAVVFKQKYGVSPSAYMEQTHDEEEEERN